MLHIRRVGFSFSHKISNIQSQLRRLTIESDILKELKNIVGDENISTSQAVLDQHGKDEGHFKSVPPQVVTWPTSTDQVSKIAKLCYNSNIPMVPFGTGTGLEGGVNALSGGVCLDMTKMNKIVEVNAEDFDCVVESGVTWRDLNEYLRDTGLWFPMDPGASASLGGMVSTGASGTNAVRHGTMRQNVLNLEVVLPNGQVIMTSGLKTRSRKSSAGYNLTGIYVGSEGTLGIVTKIALKLQAIPSCVAAAVCSFPTDEAAINTVIEILQNNISMAKMEYIDSTSMNACRSFSKVEYQEAPTLFFEFVGSNDFELNKRAEAAKEIAESNQGSNFTWAADLETRKSLWKARHDLYYACMALRPNCKALITDVCVPISKLTEVIVKTKENIDKSGLLGACVGHVGDGNFHTQIFYDPNSETEFSTAARLEHDITILAISLGGTCTGEHGVGRGKTKLLLDQYGDTTIEVMRSIKKAIDPKNLMNPGKLF